MDAPGLPPVLQDWQSHLHAQRLSPTIRAYVAAVREFRSYLAALRHAGASDQTGPGRYGYADYLLAIGYTEWELQGLVTARPEE